MEEDEEARLERCHREEERVRRILVMPLQRLWRVVGYWTYEVGCFEAGQLFVGLSCV